MIPRVALLVVLIVALMIPSFGPGLSRVEAQTVEERRAEAQAEASRREIMNFVGSSFWETAAGRRHLAEMRRREFREALDLFARLGSESWETRFDQRRQRMVLADGGQAEDLQDAVAGIVSYIEREHRLDGVEVVSPPVDGTIPERVEVLQSMVRRVLPGIEDIIGGDLLDAMKFIEVRESLARIDVLARSLRD